jgi:hypothetical protein
MAPIYYVSEEPDPDGLHEVHVDVCYLLPKQSRFLGMHANCESALVQATKAFPDVVGCRVCTFNGKRGA